MQTATASQGRWSAEWLNWLIIPASLPNKTIGAVKPRVLSETLSKLLTDACVIYQKLQISDNCSLTKFPCPVAIISPVFICMQFSAKIVPNNRLKPLPLLCVGTSLPLSPPLSHPHLGNPGSTTASTLVRVKRAIIVQGPALLPFPAPPLPRPPILQGWVISTENCPKTFTILGLSSRSRFSSFVRFPFNNIKHHTVRVHLAWILFQDACGVLMVSTGMERNESKHVQKWESVKTFIVICLYVVNLSWCRSVIILQNLTWMSVAVLGWDFGKRFLA